MAERYGKLKDIKDDQFRRLTGVKRQTFNRMLEILQEAFQTKMAFGGRKPKLSVADMLLLSLEYLREYRTYFHIAKTYEVSESAAYRTSRWVEDTLIKHPDFALPGRKALHRSDMHYEVVLVDATETPIERPKKNKGTSIQPQFRLRTPSRGVIASAAKKSRELQSALRAQVLLGKAFLALTSRR